jgi:hypothetical protein
MVQSIPQLTTFDQFIAWYPEDGRYELINGRVCEVKPTGPHEQVGGYLNRRLSIADLIVRSLFKDFASFGNSANEGRIRSTSSKRRDATTSGNRVGNALRGTSSPVRKF